MKNRPSRLGLVVEGNTTYSSVLHLGKLIEELGPVKSTGLSTARRLTNSLRSGSPVAEYEALQEATAVFIRVPDSSLDRVLSELAAAQLNFSEIVFILCESWHTVSSLQALKDRGADVATVIEIPLDRKDWFGVEGDSKAIRAAKRVIEGSGCIATEMGDAGKHFLFASELLISALPVPLFVAAQQTLRETGFSGNLLTTVLEQMLMRTVRDVMRSAKGRWGGPLLECPEEISAQHLEALSNLKPELATYVNEQLTLARAMMEPRK